MQIKTTEITGRALDWAVAQIENKAWEAYDVALEHDLPLPPRPAEFLRDHEFGPGFAPSSDWNQGGPIIDREDIDLSGWWNNREVEPGVFHLERGQFTAGMDYSVLLLGHTYRADGPTKLIAAMRCYVASRLGDLVDVPDALLGCSAASPAVGT